MWMENKNKIKVRQDGYKGNQAMVVAVAFQSGNGTCRIFRQSDIQQMMETLEQHYLRATGKEKAKIV